MQDTVKPILIFTWGNPSRGDDALGTEVYERLQKEDLADVDLLTDFQLQIEHAVDLENRERILFVDASVSAKAPFEFYRLKPVVDESYTTHAMSPESLLATYEKVSKQAPPPAFMLSIRGYDFDLGRQISCQAVAHLTRAQEFINLLLSDNSTDHWDQQQKK
jgi:hydrogenase maturation protease